MTHTKKVFRVVFHFFFRRLAPHARQKMETFFIPQFNNIQIVALNSKKKSNEKLKQYLSIKPQKQQSVAFSIISI